jgi:hypothetical protein
MCSWSDHLMVTRGLVPGHTWLGGSMTLASQSRVSTKRTSNSGVKQPKGAVGEVYEYGDRWNDVFETVFGEIWEPSPPRTGTEKDGKKFGLGGEGPNHKALRLWAKANPGRIDPAFKRFRAETELMLESADRRSAVAYERRNRDLDPQLVWRGKDEQDWSDLVVQAPPLYIQEKVHPKAIIDDLTRASHARAAGRPRTASSTCSPTSTACRMPRPRPSSTSTKPTGRTG